MNKHTRRKPTSPPVPKTVRAQKSQTAKPRQRTHKSRAAPRRTLKARRRGAAPKGYRLQISLPSTKKQRKNSPTELQTRRPCATARRRTWRTPRGTSGSTSSSSTRPAGTCATSWRSWKSSGTGGHPVPRLGAKGIVSSDRGCRRANRTSNMGQRVRHHQKIRLWQGVQSSRDRTQQTMAVRESVACLRRSCAAETRAAAS